MKTRRTLQAQVGTMLVATSLLVLQLGQASDEVIQHYAEMAFAIYSDSLTDATALKFDLSRMTDALDTNF